MYASPATETVLGIPADEAVGTSIFSRVDPTDADNLRARLGYLRETMAQRGKPMLLHLHCRMLKHGGGIFQARRPE